MRNVKKITVVKQSRKKWIEDLFSANETAAIFQLFQSSALSDQKTLQCFVCSPWYRSLRSPALQSPACLTSCVPHYLQYPLIRPDKSPWLDLQRVKKAAVPQWSTTLPPFLHPFITHLLHSSLQTLPPAQDVWRVQDGGSTGELMLGGSQTARLSQEHNTTQLCSKYQRYGGRDGELLVGRATASNGRGKCQPYCY